MPRSSMNRENPYAERVTKNPIRAWSGGLMEIYWVCQEVRAERETGKPDGKTKNPVDALERVHRAAGPDRPSLTLRKDQQGACREP